MKVKNNSKKNFEPLTTIPTNSRFAEPIAEFKKIENYGFCFQCYEKIYQHTELSKLKENDLKEFERLLLILIGCKNEKEFLHFIRENKSVSTCCPTAKLTGHSLNKYLIHIGRDGSLFRLHGVLLGKSFKIISIDPKHKEHSYK